MMTKIQAARLLTLMFFTVSSPLALANIQIYAEVDQSRVEQGDRINLQVTVQGAEPDFAPKLDDTPGLSFEFGGKSSNISMINGDVKRSYVFQYRVLVEAQGKLIIPAATTEIDGKTYQASPITIVAQKVNHKKGVSPFFVERVLESEKIYAGQAVLATATLYSQYRLLQGSVAPNLPNSVQRISIEGERTYEKIIEGVRHVAVEVADIIIPVQPGTVDVGAFAFTGKFRAPNRKGRRPSRGGVFDDFFANSMMSSGQIIQKTVRGQPKEITIQKLPDQGRPKGFSGLVGQFEISGGLSAKKLKVGDTVTLTVNIEGQGSLNPWRGIEFPENQQYKVYPDKPEMTQTADRIKGLYSKRALRFAMVPVVNGPVDFGTVSISYFDPLQEKYKNLVLKLGEIQVHGASSAGAQGSSGTSLARRVVQVGGEDYLPAKRNLKTEGRDNLVGHDLVMGYCAVGLMVLLNFGAFIRLRYQQNSSFQSRRQVRRLIEGYLKQRQGGCTDVSKLHRVYTQLLSDLVLEGRVALSVDEVEAQLRVLHIDEKSINVILSEQKSLIENSYGGQSIDLQPMTLVDNALAEVFKKCVL
jgi:hypothetical protein